MQAKSNISRRAVVKGVAWAVPAVAVGVAAPAYAVSPGCVTGITGSGVLTAWVLADHRDYELTIRFEIRPGCSVPINISPYVRLWSTALTSRTFDSATWSVVPPVPATLTATTPFTINVRCNYGWWLDHLEARWPNRADISYTIGDAATTLEVSLTSSASGLMRASSVDEANDEAKEAEELKLIAEKAGVSAGLEAGEPDATDSVDDKAVANQNSEDTRTPTDQSVRTNEPEPQQSDSQEAVGDR